VSWDDPQTSCRLKILNSNLQAQCKHQIVGPLPRLPRLPPYSKDLDNHAGTHQAIWLSAKSRGRASLHLTMIAYHLRRAQAGGDKSAGEGEETGPLLVSRQTPRKMASLVALLLHAVVGYLRVLGIQTALQNPACFPRAFATRSPRLACPSCMNHHRKFRTRPTPLG
jgi:hypothetical protein